MRDKSPWATIQYDRESTLGVLRIADSRYRQMTIYALIGTDEPTRVRYVGRTMCPESRFDQHLSGGAPRVAMWVDVTHSMGKSVQMVRLEQCEPHKGDQRENFWLQLFKQQGMADLNTARVQRVRRRLSA